MDVQFWIWVIVIVITLIARANKKPRQSEGPTGAPGNPQRPGPGKAITFEDLLREIQEAKAPSRPQPVSPKQRPHELVDYDDELEEEEKSLEDVTYDASKDDAVFKAYEAAKREAFNRPSLETIDQPRERNIQFGHFKEYEGKVISNRGRRFLKELKNPEGFRKAVILSEILNRRY